MIKFNCFTLLFIMALRTIKMDGTLPSPSAPTLSDLKEKCPFFAFCRIDVMHQFLPRSAQRGNPFVFHLNYCIKNIYENVNGAKKMDQGGKIETNCLTAETTCLTALDGWLLLNSDPDSEVK